MGGGGCVRGCVCVCVHECVCVCVAGRMRVWGGVCLGVCMGEGDGVALLVARLTTLSAAFADASADARVWAVGIILFELLTLRRPFDGQHLGTLVLILLYAGFPTVTGVIIQIFACDTSFDNGESFLRLDYDIPCSGTKYHLYRAYATVMLIVYPLGVPFLFSILLFRKRHVLGPSPPQGVQNPLWHAAIRK